MSSSSPYAQLVENILTKQASVLGMEVAVRRARRVPGLSVSDAGKVETLPAEPISALAALVEQYKALSGSMGVEFCRQVALSFRQAHPEVQLPPSLS